MKKKLDHTKFSRGIRRLAVNDHEEIIRVRIKQDYPLNLAGATVKKAIEVQIHTNHKLFNERGYFEHRGVTYLANPTAMASNF